MVDISSMKEFAVALVAPVMRAVVGWSQNAISDASDGGKNVTKFEMKQLAMTVLRVVFISVLVHFGAEGWGLDPTLGGEVAVSVLFDILTQALKSKKPAETLAPVEAKRKK